MSTLADRERKKTAKTFAKLEQHGSRFSDLGVGANPAIAGPFNELIIWTVVSRMTLDRLTTSVIDRLDDATGKMRDVNRDRKRFEDGPSEKPAADVVELLQKTLVDKGVAYLALVAQAYAFDAAVALKTLDDQREALSRIAGIRDTSGIAEVASELIASGLSAACGAEFLKTIADLYSDFNKKRESIESTSQAIDEAQGLSKLYIQWCLVAQTRAYLVEGDTDLDRLPERAQGHLMMIFEELWKEGQKHLRA